MMDMRGSVVIFFTTFDAFGAGLKRYDCETVVRQTGGLLGDDSRIVILNSKGTSGEVDRRLDAFLRYMEDDKMQDDDLTRRIDREVRRLRNSDDWYGEYMNYQRCIDDAIAEGRAEGRAEALTNAELRARLLEELGLA